MGEKADLPPPSTNLVNRSLPSTSLPIYGRCNPSSHRGGWRGQLGQARLAAWPRALIFTHSHPPPQPGTTRMSIGTLTEGGAGKL